MQRRYIHLDALSPENKNLFLSAFVKQFTEVLRLRFPAESGFALVWDDQQLAWQIVRGFFFGLNVMLVPQKCDWSVFELRFDAFFPLFKTLTRPLERFFKPIDDLSHLPKAAFWHTFGGILIALMLPLLPFYVLYRLALLTRRPDALVAAREADALWPALQATWGSAVTIARPRSLLLVYTLALAATTAATFGSFWLAALPRMEPWGIALSIAGGILVLVSVVLLIAWVLTALGLDVHVK